MSGKLFHLHADRTEELPASTFPIEKTLQTLLERNLDTFLGVRFVASEHRTGSSHAGRIDTLGLDENNSPVIIEYKRDVNESVINQGLYYLNWLVNNRAEFQLLVQEKLDQATAKVIDWSAPRVICIAGDFTKFDVHAVQQIGRNIELVRYTRYGEEHLMLEAVNALAAPSAPAVRTVTVPAPVVVPDPPGDTALAMLQKCSPVVQARYVTLSDFVTSLGEDVQAKTLKYYFAFRRLKNFVCVEAGSARGELWLYLKLDPATVPMEPGFSRDVTRIGHRPTGNLELTIASDEDLERAKPLIRLAYDQG